MSSVLGYNDTLAGDGAANRLDGGDGDDALSGGDGDDTLAAAQAVTR
jgi:Ca2+-binding RTX toxin-like protein